MSNAVQLFKALGDETRLRILNMLCRRDLCVCQIVDVLGIGQSKASRHLSHLKHAGLVTDRREGLWMYYSLSDSSAELPRQVIECLKRAKDELPMGAADCRHWSIWVSAVTCALITPRVRKVSAARRLWPLVRDCYMLKH